MSIWQKLKNHPDSPLKQFIDKDPEPDYCWLGDNPTDEELKAKRSLMIGDLDMM